MDLGEWCALVHLDIGMRTGLEVVEEQLRQLAEAADATAGTIELAILRDVRRPNHFEMIGRYESEDAYHRHQVAASNLAFRRSVGPVLGSPYEDRLHGPKGQQSWPSASIGDLVVITQVEARPDQQGSATARFDAVVAAQSTNANLVGQVALQRKGMANNLEALSVWSGPAGFEDFLGSEPAASSRASLEESLLAPIDDRLFLLFAGTCGRVR